MTGRFLTDYEGLELISMSAQVTLQFYQLLTTQRPIGEFAPHTVAVKAMEGAGPFPIWPVRRRRVPRHGPAPKAASQRPDLLAIEGPPDEIEEGSGDDEGADDDNLQEEGRFEEALEEVMDEGEVLLEGGILVPLPSDASASSDPTGGDIMPAAAPSDLAVLPPPEPEEPVPARRPPNHEGRVRGSATVTCLTVGGTIAFYPSKRAFQAICDHPDHGRCVVTRGTGPQSMGADGYPRAGRPVGFLAAWLAAGEGVATKAEHWQLMDQPLERRQELRAALQASQGGAVLAGCERERADGEPEEPPLLAGYK